MKINMSIDEFNKILDSDESKKRFKDNMKKYGFDIDEAIKYQHHILSYEKIDLSSMNYYTDSIDFSNDDLVQEPYDSICPENIFYDISKEVA